MSDWMCPLPDPVLKKMMRNLTPSSTPSPKNTPPMMPKNRSGLYMAKARRITDEERFI